MIKCPKCKKDITLEGISLQEKQTHDLEISYSKKGEFEEADDNTRVWLGEGCELIDVVCNNCGAKLDLTWIEIFEQLPKKIKLKVESK